MNLNNVNIIYLKCNLTCDFLFEITLSSFGMIGGFITITVNLENKNDYFFK